MSAKIMPDVFPYKPVQGRWVPMVTIGVKLGNDWYPMELYVDSGAAYTLLRAQIAVGIGFNYRSGNRIYLQVGDGGFIPVYLHDFEMQIGTERFHAQVGFSDKLGVGFNLLGRASVFERFRICFQEAQRVLTFEKVASGSVGDPAAMPG